HYQHSSGYTF
nr:immunoglobulin light chain junction region [Macaca mulatta]